MSRPQRFLFLQGVCSPFFPRLARALRGLGHRVRKVNFSAGDRVYWRCGEAVAYRGPMADLPEFYAKQFEQHEISDIILFGDCRPVHRPAIELARERGIRVHVFEEGYFRPYWITLERDGVNGHSRLPRNPDWYHEEALKVAHGQKGKPFSNPFWKRAAYDVGYNFWAGLNPLLHPGVQSHVPYNPITEYLGYARRGLRLQYTTRKTRRIENTLIAESPDSPFFLLPLQLNTDAQIVHHSPFASMLDAMIETMRSFSAHAPANTRLAIKIHPLDPGLVPYERLVAEQAVLLGISDRVFYLESGNLPALLSATQGVVTVNSTVGASSLIHNRPTKPLGKALYDLPGLTFQGSLDQFWTKGSRPNGRLMKDFRSVVIAHTQINGGFYSSHGIDIAVARAVERLAQHDDPVRDHFPTRLALRQEVH